jgi:thioredoxin:protein disulfide reductase
LMGALSALIVGPCVAAPLAGALLYIAQTKDAALGGAALFTMALGMGAPLVLVGVAARTALPRAGAWMEGVKKAFGVMLLGVALWLVSPVVSPLFVMLALAALLLFSGIYLHALDPLPHDASGWRRFWKGAGVMSALAGSALVIGVLAGSRDPLQPLAALRGGSGTVVAQNTAVKFERVRSVVELDAVLARADRPVMLDFYADWCVSCKEMEHLTFADPQVRSKLDRMLLVQADVTDNNPADKALLQRFKLFGPPGIVFFAPGSSTELRRVVGYQAAPEFTQVLDGALTATVPSMKVAAR